MPRNSVVINTHICNQQTLDRWKALSLEDGENYFNNRHGSFGDAPGYYNAHGRHDPPTSANGRTIPPFDSDVAITLCKGDKVWGMDINGEEYRGPIFFCPYCGEELKVQ